MWWGNVTSLTGNSHRTISKIKTEGEIGENLVVGANPPPPVPEQTDQVIIWGSSFSSRTEDRP